MFVKLQSLNEQLWTQVFKVYGTHVVDEVTLGGKVVYVKYLSSKSVDELSEAGEEVQAEASIMFANPTGALTANAGGGSSQKAKEEFRKAFSESRESVVVMGGSPSHVRRRVALSASPATRCP